MKGRWIQSQEGLLVPDSTAYHRNEREKRNAQQRRLLREIRGEYLQGWAALLLFALSIPGVVIAYSTFRDQEIANRGDRTVQTQQIERHERRYASQIGWLDYTKDAPLALHVENRSSTAVHDVILVNNGRTHALLFGTIAQCASMIADLNPLSEAARDVMGLADVATWVHGTLYFRDPVDTWARDLNGLRRGAIASAELLYFAKVLTVVQSVGLVELDTHTDKVRSCILVPTGFQAPLDGCARD